MGFEFHDSPPLLFSDEKKKRSAFPVFAAG